MASSGCRGERPDRAGRVGVVSGAGLDAGLVVVLGGPGTVDQVVLGSEHVARDDDDEDSSAMIRTTMASQYAPAALPPAGSSWPPRYHQTAAK
ncbi:MAG: hypothetical protein R2734_19350 [Nocardioides sp.]